jgi:NADPH:quinone reductase-like Zn-dependent oxidoreductase/acyl carrier protein
MGRATLPGTAYLEMAVAAISHQLENQNFELFDVTFLTPLVVDADEEKQVRTIVKQLAEGFEFIIISQSHINSDQWIEHARGEIIYTQAEPAPKHDLEALLVRCNQQELFFTEQKPKTQLQLIELGPRWQNLKKVTFGTNQELLILELPEEFAADLDSYLLHPAMLDLATGFLVGKAEDAYLPFSYKRLIFKGSLPKKIYSYIRTAENHQGQTTTLSFDITIMDEQGTELVEIEEYTLRKVNFKTTQISTAKSPESANEKPPVVQEIENFYVSISDPGMLETLTPKASKRQPPGAGEVEIEVSVTGLNFKDVLLALGLMPVPPDFLLQFGFECAGKIVAVGEGVAGFAVGDEVMGFGRSCLSRFITTDAQLVAHKPKHLSFEEAATIPIAFTTAYVALIHFGRLRQGEKVLIHAATGGVGLAAVQIAQWLGCEIFATAGSPEKREFLQKLGIEYVMDSRSLDFASEVLKTTQSQGVDVVLNSLGGEFIPKGLSVLASYGRFLELGQRDILNHSQLDLGLFEKRLSFFAIQAEPQMPNFSSLWREVVQHFESGNFKPLPCRVFSITQMTDAFEHMARAKHIGKVVISVTTLDQISTYLNSRSQTNLEVTQTLVSSLPLRSVSNQIHSDKLKIAATPTNKSSKDFLKQGLFPSEGIDVFKRILANSLPQVVVSTYDLQTRSEQWGLEETLSPQFLEKTNLSKLTHPQLELNSLNSVSRNEIEQTIANIWQELLGVKQIRIDDNFFDLGGDSLLIVQVRRKLIEAIKVNISTSELFDYPTINALAKYLSQEQEQEPIFEQVRERNKKQKEVFEEMQLMNQRRKGRE